MTVNIKQPERWGWVEKYMDLEEFQVTQDEVNLAYKFYEVPCCSYETEKHPALNCRSNIACVRNLGQAKLELTEEAVAGKKRKAEIRAPSVRDVKTTPVGLENLGATCYVNCFLQLWFHDVALRNLLFRLSVLVDRREDVLSVLENCFSAGSHKVDIVVQLRKIFAMMLYTLKPTMDPTPFLDSLGISLVDQQDASEFCQLLLFQTLEDPIMKCVEMVDPTFTHGTPQECTVGSQQAGQSSAAIGSNSGNSNFMCNRFYGSLREERTCNRCGSLTGSDSVFTHLSLNITECRSLQDCMQMFFQEELMDGNNLIYCETCGMNVAKTRKTSIGRLPRVLYVHLMRFQWQLTGRVKSKQKIDIPLYYDFQPFFDLKGVHSGAFYNDTRFQLAGAVFHIGTSSTCGHYMASIKTSKKGPWKDFNDTKVKNSTLITSSTSNKSDPESSSTSGAKKSSAKVPKVNAANGPKHAANTTGSPEFSSSDAYVLVYVADNYIDEYFCSSKSSANGKTSKKTADGGNRASPVEVNSMFNPPATPNVDEISKGGSMGDSLLGQNVSSLPLDLDRYVSEQNSLFVAKMREDENAVKKKSADASDQAVYLADFASRLPSYNPDSENHAYVPMPLIRRYFEDPGAALVEYGCVDSQSKFLCSHGRLSLQKLTSKIPFKRISASAAMTLKNSGFSLFWKNNICRDCVQEAVECYVFEERLKTEWKCMLKYTNNSTLTNNVELVRYLSTAAKATTHVQVDLKLKPNGVFQIENVIDRGVNNGTGSISGKQINEPMDVSDEIRVVGNENEHAGRSADCFVVNRKLLKEWRKIRKNAIAPQHSVAAKLDADESNGGDLVHQSSSPTDDPGSEGSTEAPVTSLTEELICNHQKINPDERSWALIGSDGMQYVLKYFPRTEKICPPGVKVCGGFGGFGDVDVDMVPWEICAECRHVARQEEDLTEVARMRLKPYQNILKELRRNQSSTSVGRVPPLDGVSRLYAIPLTVLDDLQDLINRFKENSGPLTGEMCESGGPFFLVNWDPFYCSCETRPRKIPVHVDGPETPREQFLIEQIDLEYFIITDEQKATLESLNIGFSNSPIFFEKVEKLSENTEVFLDNGCAGQNMPCKWKINAHICFQCWIKITEKADQDQYRYTEKCVYIVPKNRLNKIREISKYSGGNRRSHHLYGSLNVYVNSTDTIFDLKKKLAPRVRMFISNIELSRFNSDSQAIEILDDDERTLECCKVKPLVHLMYDEKPKDPNAPSVPDTDHNYREAGFAGSNLLSGASSTGTIATQKADGVIIGIQKSDGNIIGIQKSDGDIIGDHKVDTMINGSQKSQEKPDDTEYQKNGENSSEMMSNGSEIFAYFPPVVSKEKDEFYCLDEDIAGPEKMDTVD